MSMIDERITQEGLQDEVFLLLQIHDELVFEMKDSAVDKALPLIQEVMEKVLENSFIHYTSDVPLVVNVGVGENWGELK